MRLQPAKLEVEKCKICNFDVSAASVKAKRAALAEHAAYHAHQEKKALHSVGDHVVKLSA